MPRRSGEGHEACPEVFPKINQIVKIKVLSLYIGSVEKYD